MAYGRSNLLDIPVALHHETEKAYRVSLDGDDKGAVWIPKSLCQLARGDGDFFVLTAKEQLMLDKGLV